MKLQSSSPSVKFKHFISIRNMSARLQSLFKCIYDVLSSLCTENIFIPPLRSKLLKKVKWIARFTIVKFSKMSCNSLRSFGRISDKTLAKLDESSTRHLIRVFSRSRFSWEPGLFRSRVLRTFASIYLLLLLVLQLEAQVCDTLNIRGGLRLCLQAEHCRDRRAQQILVDVSGILRPRYKTHRQAHQHG